MDAVQAVAFVEVQVNVDELPLGTVAGFAFITTVGGGGTVVTVTKVDAFADPPGPVHVIV